MNVTSLPPTVSAVERLVAAVASAFVFVVAVVVGALVAVVVVLDDIVLVREAINVRRERHCGRQAARQLYHSVVVVSMVVVLWWQFNSNSLCPENTQMV